MIDKNNDPRKGMKVPDGFFDDFEEQIMAQVTKPKIVPLWSGSRLRAMAAVFVLALGTIFVMKWNIGGNVESYVELSEDENWEYLLDNSEDLTFDELIDFEESGEALLAIEEEIYGDLVSEELLEEIDLETIENLYE